MSIQRFPPEFKEEAVRQIVERGYSVAEVSARLGVSAHTSPGPILRSTNGSGRAETMYTNVDLYAKVRCVSIGRAL